MKRKFDTVGIDLGTTFSAIAYIDEHGDPRVVHNPDGHRPVLPSVIFFDGEEVIVGDNALTNAHVYPDQVAQLFKRKMGDADAHFTDAQQKTYAPETLSALILKKLVAMAEPEIGEVTKAVITVPAFFNEKRRAATEQAGRIAGLEIVGVLNEPSAALVAYGLHTAVEEKFYVVYDLGGGTFDVTVMRVGNKRIQELATGGNRELGGVDFDELLVNYVADEFVKAAGADPRDDAISYQTLVSDCRNAKQQLSELRRTTVQCCHAGRTHRVEVTREQFEKITKKLLSRTELTIESCLADAELSWDKIDAVMLVGGSTHMPMVRNMVQRISGLEPMTSVNSEMAVAMGAAIYAGVLDTSHGTPIAEPSSPEIEEEQTISDDSSEFPIVDEIIDEDNIDTDEDGESEDLETVELRLVNSHGVGVFAKKGNEKSNFVMIPKNSQLPSATTRLFKTSKDGMSEIRVKISEGDTEHVDACEILGTCVLGPLPQKLRKGALIELQLGYSKDGRVRVTALCKTTQTTVQAEIAAEGILTHEEVEAEQERISAMGVR